MKGMNSDDWMINGCIQGSLQALIPDQVSYYLWYEDPESPVGITLLVGEEASYDLEYESWIRFLDEIGTYLWDDKASMRGEERPIKQNDHDMDSCRYFCNYLPDWRFEGVQTT